MNQTTRYVMDIYQISVIIRDTLEYLVPKKEGYRADVYKQRKQIIADFWIDRRKAIIYNEKQLKLLNGNKEKKRMREWI